MSERLKPDALILGIDPAFDAGKPMAMVLVHFHDGTREAKSWCDGRVEAAGVASRMSTWMSVFYAMLKGTRETERCYPDMVAIEDVRSRGRGGAYMQTLIACLCEQAEMLGIRCELINPSTVKKEATGSGKASTEEVAMYVRAEYKGMDKVPLVAGEYDTEMAAAIAGAGYAKLQKEALEKGE